MYTVMEGGGGGGGGRGGGGGGGGSGSIGAVGWRFIYNAERPGEGGHLCGRGLRRMVPVCLCAFARRIRGTCEQVFPINCV